MMTSIFGTSSAEFPSDFYDEALQYHSKSSNQDEQGTSLQSPASDTDESSPPPLDLPTWDDIPMNNLPDRLETSFDYELRPGPRVEGNPLVCTWLDQDGTATYDPNDGFDPYVRPPPEIFERRRRRRQYRSEDNSDRPKRQKTSTWQRGRFEGKRLLVTLSFTTEEGKNALALYGTALDNWPRSAWRPPSGEIDWNSWWNPRLLLADDEIYGFSSKQRERRGKAVQVSDEDTKSVDITDLIGHPVARGCKGCLNVGQRCPLLNEGSRYPCEICIQDDVDCELIREPAEKGACLNCGRKRICCSYRKQGSDHNHPCSYCTTLGLKCIAGPASGRTRTGPALDSALPDRLVAIAKNIISCTQCRRAKRWCSRSKNRTAATCNVCTKNSDICTLEPTQRTKARVKCDEKLLSRADASSKPNIRPQPSWQRTQFIKTRLPHPIELNYVGDEACQWCQDMGYGIMGLGDLLEAEVVDFNDGNGYIELDGGYFGAGYGPSRMCNKCTFERLAIAACLRHDIQDLRSIDGMDVNSFDFNCIYDYLAPGRAATAPFPWCSICPNAAFLACCKRVDADLARLDGIEDAQQQHGCGLRLCEDCALSLIHESGGDLEVVVAKMKNTSEEGTSLRADVDLILPGGELVRRIGC